MLLVDFPFGVVAVAAKPVLLLGERVFQQFRQSVCSVASSLCLGVCLLFTRLPTNFSAVHSVVSVCAGDIRLLFKLLIKFRNIPRDEGPLLVIKKDIRTALNVFVCFETKQNET